MASFLIVGAIAVSVVLGYTTKFNVGFFAILFGYILGSFIVDMRPRDIIGAWPTSTMFSIMAVTLFYNFALVNGTLEKLSGHLLYVFRNYPSLLPFVLFFVATFISAIGAGNFAVVAFMAPITLMLCDEIKLNPVIGAIAINTGSLAGGNFMTSNLGIIFRGLMDDAVKNTDIANHDSFFNSALIFIVSIVFSLIFISIFRLISKGSRTAGANMTFTKPEPFTDKQRANLYLIFTMLVFVLFFPVMHLFFPGIKFITYMNARVDVSLVAMVFAVIALMLKLAPEKDVVSRVPWSTIIMVCGVGILIQVAIKAGTINMLASWMGGSIPVFVVPVVLGLIAGCMSFFSSTIGVVCPALFPLIPALAAATGISPLALFTCTVIGSQSTAISPFSSSGSLIVASSPDETKRNKLFNDLIFKVAPVSILTAAAINLVLAQIL